MAKVQTDKSGKPIQLIVAWVITVLTVGYMLPWAIAASRGKSNSGAIGLVTFLLGWTVIGWIVGLVMACGAHQVVAQPMQYQPMPPMPQPGPPAPPMQQQAPPPSF